MDKLANKKGFHLVPAICSFLIPGLGQLVKGQVVKAIVIWAVVGLLYWIFGWMPILWIIASFAWLVNLLDAAFGSAE